MKLTTAPLMHPPRRFFPFAILRRHFFFSVVLLVVISGVQMSYAQCDTNQIANFYAKPIGGPGTDSVPGWKILPGFGFEMHYDSGRTMYRVAEFKKNGQQLWLHGWCDGKTIRNLDAQALSNSSRTVPFAVATGDSISFFRELAWFNPITIKQTLDGYYALDTLDYAVELVDASTGARLALLDAIGVLRNVPTSSPLIYGMRPVMTIVSYVVPPSLNGKTVFIRMDLQARGDGLYDFVRTDRWGLDLSDRFTDPYWQEYLELVGDLSSGQKRVLKQYQENENLELTATPSRSDGLVTITFDTPDDGRGATVVAYDMEGKAIFAPAYIPRGNGGKAHTTLKLQEAGTYIIVLYYAREPVRSTKVVVTK